MGLGGKPLCDTHVPLIMRIPGLTDSGMQLNNPVELVDVFPTLVAATGLPPIPACPETSNQVEVCHEGMNLLSKLRGGRLHRKRPAYSQVIRRNGLMGFSVRTPYFRYTEYTSYDYYRHEPIWNVSFAGELYDYRQQLGESINRISDPRYKDIRQALQITLHRGWKQDTDLKKFI